MDRKSTSSISDELVNSKDEKERRKNSESHAGIESYFSPTRNSFFDIFSTRFHSDDFTLVRTNYINARLWAMCLFFSVSVPFFSLFDYFFFPKQEFLELLLARIILSFSLIALAHILKNATSAFRVRMTMPFAFIFPMFFYISSMYIVRDIPIETIPTVFTMMPFLIVAMMGLFPLTISGSGVIVVLLLSIFLSFKLIFSNSGIVSLLNQLWLFLVFVGISMWLQMGQLSMLMKLYRESTVDPLTKLINRRVLLRMAELEESKHQLYSLIMFDLDRFKRINDLYGHAIGDKVLVTVSQIIKQELRQGDIVARFGGEEFVALLPQMSLNEAQKIASRVAKAISQHAIAVNENEEINVTSSIGVTEKKITETIEESLKRADDFLYFAKESGRNKVISDKEYQPVTTAA